MTAIHALVGFTAWTLLLVLLVFAYRGGRFLAGTPINSWPRGAKVVNDAPMVQRLENAHANCLENLPVFAVIVLCAAALGRPAAVEVLAPFVLYARIGQTAATRGARGRWRFWCGPASGWCSWGCSCGC